jgi:hypothetical protein
MKMLLNAKSLALASMFLGVAFPTIAQASPIVCAHEPEDQLIFTVTFSASWENSLTLINTDTGQRLRTFNNFVGRGAGGEWNQGAGTWTFSVDDNPCVELVAQHKAGEANSSLPWNTSRFRHIGSGRFGFEDGADTDFNDIGVRVRVRSFNGSISAPDIR